MGACVDLASSDQELESLLPHGEVPSPDWGTETLLVAYKTLGGGGPTLEIADVWDTGGNTLQVDLTLHLTQGQTAMITCVATIASVPRGDYIATATVTESRDWRRSR